ncbi:hypothetical protein CW304_00380 [Bacillus sp. UFRGS-B20]|nr:hypothetical protein CW304_00380 [Bacillus sp. UFRGS-B20]
MHSRLPNIVKHFTKKLSRSSAGFHSAFARALARIRICRSAGNYADWQNRIAPLELIMGTGKLDKYDYAGGNSCSDRDCLFNFPPFLFLNMIQSGVEAELKSE